jgi:enoyl-CoA hydratase
MSEAMNDEQLRSAVEGGVATCRIDRHRERNSLGPELMDALAAELERLDGDGRVRCIVVAGSDDVFASGAEVRALADEARRELVRRAAVSFWERIGTIATPTVAAVSGWALAEGCELALACDMCVAAEGSQFGQPEVTLGIIPGGGATQRLSRAIGKQRAMELVLTGRRFSAEQAHSWGLVNRVSKRREWLADARQLATAVAARAPIATRLGKRAVLAAEQLTLERGLELERSLLEEAISTADRVEAMNALLEGREPTFEGR